MAGGFLLGILIANFIPEEFLFVVIIGFPILFELVEQLIGANLLNLIEPEPFFNIVADIILTIIGILVGIQFAQVI